MRTVLAILLPFVMFLTIGRIGSAFAAMILQASGPGWIIASWWAFRAKREYEEEQIIRRGLVKFARSLGA